MATKWLTAAEAARRLGVSESTVWRLLRRERLPSVKVGGRRRIAAAMLSRVAQPVGIVPRPEDFPPLGLDDALFTLAGRFRSAGTGAGSSDKHGELGRRP